MKGLHQDSQKNFVLQQAEWQNKLGKNIFPEAKDEWTS